MDVDIAYLTPVIGDLAERTIDVASHDVGQSDAEADEPNPKDEEKG
jgi:hypothetical protein